jgi:hypothetical protein
MNIYQERKYNAVDGKIVNRATGEPIPDNEPIIIFRAKDVLAVPALQYYMYLCKDDNHRQVIDGRIEDFLTWQAENPKSTKEPDSDVSCLK